MLKDFITPKERLAPHDKLARAKRYLARKKISATTPKHKLIYVTSEHGSRVLNEHRNAGIRAS